MKINDDFVIREIANEYIIVPVGETAINFNGMITVNEVGKFIWETLHEDLSKEELIEKIIEEYDVEEETVNSDVDEFIERLQKEGIIEK